MKIARQISGVNERKTKIIKGFYPLNKNSVDKGLKSVL